MYTTSYIAKSKVKRPNSYSLKTNSNYIERITSKLKGIILSLNTTGFLTTLSFFLFTRKYRHLQVVAFSCIANDNKIYYFKAGKNEVSLRNKYIGSDFDDLFPIDLEEYKTLGKINNFKEVETTDQKIWITKLISILYYLRYGKNSYNAHLLGSGKFAAGVILPNILKSGGKITKIKETEGKSSQFIAESFGISKNVLDSNFFSKNPAYT